jgi:hypothetical protein
MKQLEKATKSSSTLNKLHSSALDEFKINLRMLIAIDSNCHPVMMQTGHTIANGSNMRRDENYYWCVKYKEILLLPQTYKIYKRN